MATWYSHQPDAITHWITGNPAVLAGGDPTLYAVVGPSIGWVNPSSAEIIAGTLAGGGLAAWIDEKPASSLTSDPFTWPNDTTGLTAGTWYRAAVVWSDGSTTSQVVVSTPWQAGVVYTGSLTTHNVFKAPAAHVVPTGPFKASPILGPQADVWIAQGRGLRKADNCLQPLATATAVQARLRAKSGRYGSYIVRNNAIDAYSAGVTLTPRADAVNECWLIVMGDQAPVYGGSSAMIGVTTTHGINCFTDRIVLRGFSSELLVLTEAFTPGKAIYGHLRLNSQRIKTVNSDVTASGTWGDVLFTDALLDDAQSISMLIRWTNFTPTEQLIERLLRNPMQALVPNRVYMQTLEAEPASAAAFSVKSTRTRNGFRLTQPKGTPRIARNSLTVGMTGCLWAGGGPGGVRDLVSRNPTWPVKNSVRRVTPQGTAQECDADYHNIESQRSGLDASNPAGEPAGWRPSAPPITLMAYFAHTASGAASTPLAGAYSTGYLLSDYLGSRSLQAAVRINATNTVVYQVGTTPTTPIVRGLTASTTELIGWDNGVSFASGVIPSLGSFEYDPTFGRIGLMGSGDYSGANYRGYGYWMAIWKRVLTPREIKFLAANPWAIFAPDELMGVGLLKSGNIKPLQLTSKFAVGYDPIDPAHLPIDLAVARGHAMIDFGAGVESTTTTVSLPSLTPINPTKVQLWVSADDFTESHTPDEHKYLTLQARLSVGYDPAGFIIHAYATQPLTGKYKLRYSIG